MKTYIYPSAWFYVTTTNPDGDGGFFIPYDFYLELKGLKPLPKGWKIKKEAV